MRRLLLRSASAALLLLGAARAETSPKPGEDPLSVSSGIAPVIADLDALPAPSETAGGSGPVAGESGAMGGHASLAFFSLGSLAVGGVFYGINASLDRPNVSYIAGDRTRISTAVGVAGLTALIAAGSYLFCAHRDAEKAHAWAAHLSGGASPGGGIQVAAALDLPLPPLLR